MRMCARAGCSQVVKSGYCGEHRRSAPASANEKRRGSSAARGYGYRWQVASKAYLREHPIAVDYFGTHGGRAMLAEVVDHIVPHRGDMRLFWDPANWQGLTKEDHDRKTAIEDGGFGQAPIGRKCSNANGLAEGG